MDKDQDLHRTITDLTLTSNLNFLTSSGQDDESSDASM